MSVVNYNRNTEILLFSVSLRKVSTELRSEEVPSSLISVSILPVFDLTDPENKHNVTINHSINQSTNPCLGEWVSLASKWRDKPVSRPINWSLVFFLSTHFFNSSDFVFLFSLNYFFVLHLNNAITRSLWLTIMNGSTSPPIGYMRSHSYRFSANNSYKHTWKLLFSTVILERRYINAVNEPVNT